MREVRLAVVGAGNCASALVQGIAHYANGSANEAIGLMHREIGGFRPRDLRVVAAWDIDRRKVGLDMAEAIFAPPNCTTVFCGHVEPTGAVVEMGAVLDGVAPHMTDFPEDARFAPADLPQPDARAVTRRLRETGTDVLINYLPVGSQAATEFYAGAAADAGVAFVNCIPVFIASDAVWAERFRTSNAPLIGDDIKSQLGATILHRTLTELFGRRGVALDRTYQLNIGGNTDFLNMLARDRLASKKRSKTEAVQAAAQARLPSRDIHVGPSDYVAWAEDNKIAYVRMEGRLFGGVPMNLEVRLSVEDSPNSAGVAIDLIRCAKLARDRGLGGVIHPPAAAFCKHPPVQVEDGEAHAALEAFIAGAPIN